MNDPNPAVAVTLIADDLTGACDAGALFAGRGRVSVIVGAGAVDPARDVVALDTESRAVSPVEARHRMRAAARRLGARLHTGLLFKKIDSTLRGPVGGEVEALQDLSGRRTALVCPAFPEQGRTVVDGLLRVGGTPAHATSVGLDPAYPGGTSDVAEILRRGALRAIRHLPLACVRAGREHLLTTLARAGVGILSADAETDADLDTLAAAATSPDVVLAGSAGLARAVAAQLGREGPPVVLPGGAWLIVAGSLHPATRAQLRALEAAGVAGVAVDDRREPDLAAVAGALRGGRPAFLATVEPAAGTPSARSRAATALAEAAARLVAQSPPSLVVVTGGDTAYALLMALGADHLELSGSPASGLALADLVVDGAPSLAVLTKAGGFGPPDLFLSLLKGTP